jgi:hypothetical protein
MIAAASTMVEGLLPQPFIGHGFSSVVGAVVIVAALVVLIATRAMDPDVVGVILGALTGYCSRSAWRNTGHGRGFRGTESQPSTVRLASHVRTID